MNIYNKNLLLIYSCSSCGQEVDKDHDYCPECDQRGGQWELQDDEGRVAAVVTKIEFMQKPRLK